MAADTLVINFQKNSIYAIIGWDDGFFLAKHRAIIETNVGLLLIWALVTKFQWHLNPIRQFSFKKINLKMSSAEWQPCCLGLNVCKMLHKRQAYGSAVDTSILQKESIKDYYSLTVTSHEGPGIWNHWKLDCLSNGLFNLFTKKTPKLHITGHYRPFVRESNKECGFL